MVSTLTPKYPNPRARGMKSLGGSSEKPPRVNSISALSPESWSRHLTAILCSGCGLLLSPTSDLGAISVTLYHGDDRSKGYASSKEELEDLLEEASDTSQAFDLQTGAARRAKASSSH